MVANIFWNPQQIEMLNETLITLIPKVELVLSLKRFHPISLCNVSYKIVTKILANRLKRCMEKLVAPTQCSFVLGRHSSDNIIITQEVVHSMRKKKGKKGKMDIQIDLEKAYDRLKWSFVRDRLQDIRVPESILELRWKCISLPSLRVLWNGEALDSFRPSHGIRQRDPISPYIFVLCIERLSQLINKAVNHGFWKPIQLSRNDPKLSHLCFADDLILLLEVRMDQVEIIRQCLDAFCTNSG